VAIVLLAAGVAAPTAIGAALLVAAVTTVLEAVTPWGLDNLTVPITSGVLLWLLV
jgi:dolichol kinase